VRVGAGYYVSTFGAAAPTAVPEGMYTSDGGTSPAPCPPGGTCNGGLLTGMTVTTWTLNTADPANSGNVFLPSSEVGNVSAMPVSLTLPLGDGIYQITGFSFTGADASLFSLLGLDIGDFVVSGGSLDFSVLFSPLISGTFSVDLHILAQQYLGLDPDFTFHLTGLGLAATGDGVPSPASAAIFLPALLAVATLRRRRKAA
jgi:hypothetical protein